MPNPACDDSLVLTCLGGERHGFEHGDNVTISGVRMLDRDKPWTVNNVGPFAFAIGDADDPVRLEHFPDGPLHDAKAKQVKLPVLVHHEPLEHSETEPEFVQTDWSRPERAAKLHMLFRSMELFEEKHAREFDPMTDRYVTKTKHI